MLTLKNVGIFMPDEEKPKRKAGRPQTFPTKQSELKLYISPEAFQDFKQAVIDSGMPGTEIGRRLISFYLEATNEMRSLVLGGSGVNPETLRQVAAELSSRADYQEGETIKLPMQQKKSKAAHRRPRPGEQK